MKVLALRAEAETNGCYYYRLGEPARVARDLGVDVQISADLDVDGWVNPDGSAVINKVETDADVIIFQRPLLKMWAPAIRQAQKQGIACIVELDDNLSRVHKNHAAHHPLNIPIDGLSFSERAKYAEEAAALADLVTVSTPALARFYGKHGRVKVLRNRVPASIFDIEKQVSDPVRAGWTGTVMTHPWDLDDAGQHVGIALRDTDAQFSVIGDGQLVREKLGITESTPVNVTPWVLGVDAYHRTIAKNMDVGIVPLEDSEFNDCKCLDAETLITTDRGVVPIRSVTVGDHVLAAGKLRLIEAVSKETPTPGIELITKYGRSIKLTRNHRLLVNGEWTQAGSISRGDTLTLQPESTYVTDYQRANWPADGRKTRSEDVFNPQAFVDACDSPSVLVNERWARFMGLFVGDGSMSGKSGLGIACDGDDKDLIDLIADDIRAFGLRPCIDWSPKHRRAGVRVSSAHLNRFFESLGLVARKDADDVQKGYTRTLIIPDVIWRSPHSVIAAFLSGLFEADGSAGTSVGMTTKSIQLARQVQHALMLFGIPSRIKEFRSSGFGGAYADRSYYSVYMLARASSLFQQRIGFLSERKKSKMEEREQMLSERRSGARDRRHYGGRPLDFTDEVLDIREVWVEPVDIQVDGEQFTVGGVVSHNSALKGMEMAALGIPFVASPTPEYLRLNKSGIGYVARKGIEWQKKLRRLLTNRDFLLEESARHREAMRAHTYEEHGHEWVTAWSEAVANRRADARIA